MAKSDIFDLLTDIPSALLALKTTSESVVTPLSTGQSAISGFFEISLFGQTFKARVPDEHPLIAGLPTASGGRTLDSCPPIGLGGMFKKDVVNAAEGPGIAVMRWTFSKRSGEAPLVIFNEFAVWSCKQSNAVPQYPGQKFALLLPGVGIKDSELISPPNHCVSAQATPLDFSGGSPAYPGWLQSADGDGRLLKGADGWMIEHNCKLYPCSGYDPVSPAQGGITFATPDKQYPHLTFFVNFEHRDRTRVRLFLTEKGVPSALELDAPQTPASSALLCLRQPRNFPLTLSPPQSQDGNLPLERIRIERELMRAFMHRGARNRIDFGPCATWSGSGSRIAVCAKLPTLGHDTSGIASITFASIPNPPVSVHDDARFDGLRIKGIDSTGRPKEVLDAQDLRATVLLEAGAADNPKAALVDLACGWLGPREGQCSQDGRRGVLHMPIGQALLEVERNRRASPFNYSLKAVATGKKKVIKWEGKLTATSPILRVPPFGGAASSVQTKDLDAYSRYVKMRLRPNVQIEAKQSTQAPRLEMPKDWQLLWELDGAQALRLHDLANLGADFKSVSFKQGLPKTEVAQAKVLAADSGNETLAYATLGLVLAYIAGEYKGGGWDKFFERELKLNFDEGSLANWAERNRLEDVIVSLGNLSTNAVQKTWFRNFVLDNLKQRTMTGPPPTGALWPFAPGLGIPLYEGTDPATATWLWSIKRNRNDSKLPKELSCFFAFDYSRVECFTPPSHLGTDFFKNSAKNAPALWPRTRTQFPGQLPGAVEDPGSKLWSGIFIANVPMVLPEVPQGAQFFQRLRNAINSGLRLEYGWLDANGHTWNALWEGNSGGVRLYPFSEVEDPPVEILLEAFRTTGAQGQTATSTLKFRLIFHSIINKKTNEPVELAGQGQFGAVSGQQSYLELKPIVEASEGGGTIETDSLPGFEKLSFKRFRTNFSDEATLEVGLVAGKPLREAIPFFDRPDEITAVMSIPLRSDGKPSLALRLPAEAPTRMFGKWPIGIRALEFTMGEPIHTRIHFALDLGIPLIKRAGGYVDIVAKDPGVGFAVTLYDVEIDINTFGVKITGALAWRNPKQGIGGGTDPLGENLEEAANRDFYGSVRVSGMADSGEAGIYLRIGSEGRPFWVGALMSGKDPSVAGTKLEDSVFLIAYGAQQTHGDALRQALSLPEKVLPRSLFPTRDNTLEWLNSWHRASDGLGLAVGLTGQFSPDRLLATAPGKDNLSVLWSDSGLFYASARVKLLATFETDFHLLVDFANKLITAGLQLPGLKVGGGVEVTAGYLSATLAWGEKRQGFGFSMGYPPIDTHLDLGIPTPNWSKAVSARISSAWPVNTFQGGLKAWYYTKPVSFGLGLAVRVGYSNSWQVTGRSIADARADVGVMVGGTFLFCRTQIAGEKVTVLRLTDSESLDNDRGWLLDTIEAYVEEVMPVSASIFADVWGHASVVFLGVTIAGVRIEARAAFNVNGELERGILYMGARFDFRVSVKIGCSSYSTSCHFSIVMINRGSGPAGNCNRLQSELIDRLLTAEAEVL